jgi:hypothetical protein
MSPDAPSATPGARKSPSVIHRMLVGVDGADGSRHAGEWTSSLAEAR